MTLKPLRLAFQLSEAEFVRAHRAHLRKGLLTPKNVGLITFALALGMLQMQVFGGASLALRVFAGLWIAVMAFLAWAFFHLPRRLFRQSPRHGKSQTILVEDDGLKHETEDETVFVPWAEIRKSRSDDEFYFLYTDPKGIGRPIVIPRRALGSEEAEERFRQDLLEKLAGPRPS